MKKINVTKPYLPNREKFDKYIDQIYQSNWLTNNGPLVQELEKRLRDYLGVKNIVLTANGTLALQVAYKLLDLKGEVVTTPFSFVATSSSLAWENLKPVFADINEDTLNFDPKQVESKITDKTAALLPVHVFGNPCEVEKIKEIADKNNLKVIYDAAHAFGVKYKRESILNWGDVSILSFHATKIFHTIEGGALIINDDELYRKAKQMINFGYEDGAIKSFGVNAKMNEFSAAMGLCLLDDIEKILSSREEVWEYYYQNFKDICALQNKTKNSTNNYHYFPIILKSEEEREKIQEKLSQNGIYPRRYFWPSLDCLDYLSQSNDECSSSKNISERILCLPIYPELDKKDQDRMLEIIMNNLSI
ncbi:MAG: DegT/DnrJ/EryC1/StrS family aminotransferase [Candidatus Moranbacteria bacterium]|nr:DegT/DnrJ/EryC1/StrS family aminotransferase [Candidatus Moranbacteria bacterium]